MRALRVAAAAAVAAATMPVLAGCAAQPPTTWIGKTSGQVVMLDWVDAHGSISGTANVTTAAKPGAAGSATSSSSVQVSGTESGGKISLRFGGSILGVSSAGSISGNSLTLDSVGTFTPGTASDYATATSALAASVTTARTTAADAKTATDLSSAIKTVNGDLARLQDEKPRARAALASLRTAVAAVSAAGCASGGDSSPAQEALMAASSVGSGYVDDVDSLPTDLAALHDATSRAGASADHDRATALYRSSTSALPDLQAYSAKLTTNLTALSDTLTAAPTC